MTDLFSNFTQDLRQWRYPKAFRIPGISSSNLTRDIETTFGVLGESIQTLSDPEFLSRARNFTAADDREFINELLTRLWRIRKYMLKPSSKEPNQEIKKSWQQ